MSQPVGFAGNRSRPPWPDRLRALLALGLARVLVRFVEVEKIARLLDLLRRRLARRPATTAEAAHAMDVVTASSIVCAAGRDSRRCSVAIALYCLTKRSWVEWCLGMRRSPLETRAWVQVDGRPVDERVDAAAFLPVLAVGRDGVTVGL